MSNKKIFIIGPGRSGTTFLIKLFTRLGFNTGLTSYQEEHYRNEWRAGCEYSFSWDNQKSKKEIRQNISDNLPYIMKAPIFSFQLKDIIKQDLIKIEKLIIPVRDIDISTQSRLDVELYWPMTGKDFDSQKAMSYAALGASVELGILYNIPMIFLKFPDFLDNPEKCYNDLNLKVNYKNFKKVFNQLKQPIKYG